MKTLMEIITIFLEFFFGVLAICGIFASIVLLIIGYIITGSFLSGDWWGRLGLSIAGCSALSLFGYILRRSLDME